MISFLKPFSALVKGWIACLALAIGIAFTLGALLRSIVPLPWPLLSLAVGAIVLPWALLAPLVFRLTNRLPIESSSWKVALPLHLVIGAAVAAVMTALNPGEVSIDTEVKSHVAADPPASSLTLRENDVEPAASPASGTAATFVGTFLAYLVLLGIAHLWFFHRASQHRQRESLHLSASLARARLHALRMQIHPHFLFNALNTLGNLIRTNPDAADEMLVALSAYLRRSLDDIDEEEIPLGRELQSVRAYLEIQKLRFDGRFLFFIDASPDSLAAKVPSMLLQPLVENAVRHGIEPKPDGGTLRIESRRDTDTLRIEISDNGVGFPSGPVREGIGLANSRARLRALHGDVARLDISFHKGSTVTVELPWRA